MVSRNERTHFVEPSPKRSILKFGIFFFYIGAFRKKYFDAIPRIPIFKRLSVHHANSPLYLFLMFFLAKYIFVFLTKIFEQILNLFCIYKTNKYVLLLTYVKCFYFAPCYVHALLLGHFERRGYI